MVQGVSLNLVEDTSPKTLAINTPIASGLWPVVLTWTLFLLGKFDSPSAHHPANIPTLFFSFHFNKDFVQCTVSCSVYVLVMNWNWVVSLLFPLPVLYPIYIPWHWNFNEQVLWFLYPAAVVTLERTVKKCDLIMQDPMACKYRTLTTEQLPYINIFLAALISEGLESIYLRT